MGNAINKRQAELLAEDETDRLYNQLASGEPIPGLNFNLMILGRGFARQPGFWKPLIRCIAAAVEGDRAAKRVLTSLNDLADRFLVYMLSDEGGRDEKGFRRWSEVWQNEWTEYTDRLTAWHARRTSVGSKASAPKSSVEPLPETLSFSLNGVQRAVVATFSTPSQWGVTPIDFFSHGAFWHTDHLDLGITVGMRQSEESPMRWENLRASGPRMVKAHYALCAHWQGRATGGRDPIRVNINQFCHDLGYKKHHNGGFRRRDKQEAIKTLQTLIAIELEICFTPTGGREQRLRGPLWSLGLIAEERNRFGERQELEPVGDASEWVPIAFSYAPGDWFYEDVWRVYTRQIGKIGAGLLNLDNHNDRGAILIGGYIGTLSWPGRRLIRLRVSTILKRTGLAQDEESYRRAGETRQSFERNLLRLKEEFVITDYHFKGNDVSDLSDPDDPDEVAAYYNESLEPANEWRKQVIEFEINIESNAAALSASRLEDAAH
jgi:hypothetical protein